MIAVLGGNGYVGSAICRELNRRHIPFHSLSRADTDYADTRVLTAWLRVHKPEFLINAAGYTGKPNVDACETDKANCLFGNAVLPGRIAEACRATDTPWGHVSSGCIYSGRRADGAGFTEEDPPNFSFRSPPCSFYSGTKALGEEVLANEPNCYLWRLRIPFNHQDGPRNFLSKILRYARLLDAENSISHLDEFAAVTIDSWLKRIPFGTYNVTNPGHITTRQVAALLTEMGMAPHPFQFFSDEADFMRAAAHTPRSNCVLDGSKLANTGIHLSPIEDALRDALRSWIPERIP